jgi:undecaprenyl-diphosphatase
VAELDRRLFLALHGDDPSRPLALAMIVLTLLGSGWMTLGLVPLLVLERTRRAAAILAAAIVAQSALVWALKALIARVRPWQALALTPLFDAPTDFSFPSGHAAGSFTCAAFVAALLAARSRSPRALGACALAFALAGAIALSRVYLAVHYPGDVLGGAIIGVSVGSLAAHLHGRRRGTV